MGMTLNEAQAFRLPNGKSMGEATIEDWKDASAVFADVAAKLRAADGRYLSKADKDALQQDLQVVRKFVEAASVIKAHLSGHAVG
jgi:hypothetical protein